MIQVTKSYPVWCLHKISKPQGRTIAKHLQVYKGKSHALRDHVKDGGGQRAEFTEPEARALPVAARFPDAMSRLRGMAGASFGRVQIIAIVGERMPINVDKTTTQSKTETLRFNRRTSGFPPTVWIAVGTTARRSTSQKMRKRYQCGSVFSSTENRNASCPCM